MTKPLSLKDLTVSKSSYVDPNGFVFHYDNHIYRAIRSDKETFYRSLFEKGAIARLVKKNSLVDSRITDFSVPESDSPLVIHHRNLEVQSYCVEWSPSMLKDAALLTLDLAIELTEDNCLLQDAYPWNILFDGSRPLFIDLTSIVPADGPLIWPAYQQFLSFFLYPLEMMQMNRGDLARSLLMDHIHGVSRSAYLKSHPWNYPFVHPLKSLSQTFLEIMDKTLNKADQGKRGLMERLESVSAGTMTPEFRRKFFQGLRKKVEKIQFNHIPSHWKGYYKDRHEENVAPDIAGSGSWTVKQKRVSELLKQIKPSSVLDVGCNTGWYSLLAARHGLAVVAVDSDEACVDLLYRQSVHENLKILPLILNMNSPTPGFGHMSQQFPPALQRLRRDTVLGLAVIHHMHITDRQSFDQIAQLFRSLGERAILEYIDTEDPKVKILDVGRKIHYNLESVTQSFKKFFKSVQVFPSDVETRKILLCE